MSQECLRVQKNDGVWTLTLNRPEKRNALNAELVEALIDAVDQVIASDASVLVLRGEGKNFCAGFDFSDFENASEGDLLWRFVRIEQLLQKLNACSVLTVALVHGKNFGAGVDLMVTCKHRVATATTTFRMPGLKFGLVLGTRRLARLIGAQRVRQIQQVAKTLDANDALQSGLVCEVQEPVDWDAVVNQQVLAGGALSSQARAALYEVLRENTDDADIADLVRSVLVPGLKRRIAKYRAAD
ncbi:enoyl-CoA hydratase/isomerase family protein [Orrella daihaiensis]|uniref:Enoyl-CoA hydratase/isomerase family protein n=1 Tax=Orrella daihaiensis TaxID=2782176 RepID=A0ABY4AJZ2_9BURK|nr:enoyl-CoA hydratase/isomerase family protein [Orrella daihaiensis]UOD49715.1 enoyl-CoA hydratase/isomerase family protein [Orrella daihaiensis]